MIKRHAFVRKNKCFILQIDSFGYQTFLYCIEKHSLACYFYNYFLFSIEYVRWYQSGYSGMIVGGVGCLGMVIFAMVIWIFTQNLKPPEPEIKRQKLGLITLLFYFLFLILCVCYWRFGWKTQLPYPLNNLFLGSAELTSKLFVALRGILIGFLIPFILFRLFKYRSKDMGICIRFWWLGLLLMCIFSCAEFVSVFVSSGTAHLNKGFLFDFVDMFFTVGFVEEFCFRGLLQPHLEAISKNKLNGAVIMAILFGLWHFPANVVMFGAKPLAVIAGCLGGPAIFGLLMGYLYLRTRSIAPGSLFHAWYNTMVSV
jgi:membrane protease YdiL (CAAX protease family)